MRARAAASRARIRRRRSPAQRRARAVQRGADKGAAGLDQRAERPRRTRRGRRRARSISSASTASKRSLAGASVFGGGDPVVDREPARLGVGSRATAIACAAASIPVTAKAEPRHRLGDQPAAAADIEQGSAPRTAAASAGRGRNARRSSVRMKSSRTGFSWCSGPKAAHRVPPASALWAAKRAISSGSTVAPISSRSRSAADRNGSVYGPSDAGRVCGAVRALRQ